MPETTWANASQHQSLGQTILDYYQLTKPRLIILFLITTAAAMWVAAQGRVEPLLLVVTLLSGTFAAAAANVINCWYDRDIDAIMERTQNRPLPAGRIKPWEALLFAAILAGLAFILLAVFANLLSACLAMAGIAVYIGVYTYWLKRSSPENIVIGGAAGAIPPLVGWAAVTGDLGWPAWTLFAIVFVWTPPHFWPLAMMIQDDYAKVGVPMLPVVAGDRSTARRILAYTLALLPLTLLLVYPLHAVGPIYAVAALILGGLFIYKAWQLLQAPEDKQKARSLFKYSILYMMLLCAGMVVDSLPTTHALIAQVTDHLQTVVSAVSLAMG